MSILGTGKEVKTKERGPHRITGYSNLRGDIGKGWALRKWEGSLYRRSVK